MRSRVTAALLALLTVPALACERPEPAESAPPTPAGAEQPGEPHRYRVDPLWPKPLPTIEDTDGVQHDLMTGDVGSVCVDSHDHIITVNRAFESIGTGGLRGSAGRTSIPAAPVQIFEVDGTLISSWGDPALTPVGGAAVLPAAAHGCFADYEDNIWLSGYQDGVVQKWSHDGGELLLQIGTKGVCDGKPYPDRRPSVMNSPYPTCGEVGLNESHTLLNSPADLAVDPDPDPVTGEPGSVYIADGYGNHRIVVFDGDGNYLRQWGSAGNGPGQFGERGGGHPHCVVIGSDSLVYACDRPNHRIHVFDRTGDLKRTIPVEPIGWETSGSRAVDIAFSSDPDQQFMAVVSFGSNRVWILDRESGTIVGSFGRSGHQAGEFTTPHAIASDSQGNLYVAETLDGSRIQKSVIETNQG